MQIDSDKFDFFIKLQDPNKIGFIDQSIYTVKAFINSVLPNGTSPSLDIDIEPCKNSTFTDENLELFFPYNFTNSWCISRNQSKVSKQEIRLQGVYGQLDFHMLIFKFYVCANTSTYKNCSSQEIINSYLSNAYLSLYTIDNFIQTNNFDKPTTKAVKGLFITISNNYYATATLFYDRIQVTSDIGLIFAQNHILSSISANPLLYNFNFQITGKFASFALQLNNIKIQYFRKYMKLAEFLAQVGGLLQVIKIIATIIYTYYNQHFYFEDLFNGFFSYSSFNDPLDSARKSIIFNLFRVKFE